MRTDLGELDSNDSRRVGFIAQQVQETIPNTWTNIVATNPFNGSLTLDYSKLTPILFCAIQALANKVSDLESTKTTAKAKKKYNPKIIFFNHLFICYLYFFIKINHECII